MLIALNKPYGVLCQFRDPDGRPTLAGYVRHKDVYPAGRLDHDSSPGRRAASSTDSRRCA